VKKLAVEEVGAENSRAGIGKTYRIYSYTSILAQRRLAGMEWVIRTKGVSFVDKEGREFSVSPIVSVPPTDLIPDAYTVSGHDSAAPTKSVAAPPAESGGEPPTDSIPPYRNSFRNNPKETSSSTETSRLIDCLAALGISLDDDAGRRIISRCENTDHTATVEEIAFFAELKVRQLAKRRDIENWPGLLMAAVPAYFDPPATELSRYRAGKRRERERQEEIARQVLSDAQSAEGERAWAQSVLSPLGSDKTGT
jgi:hypothetical protein